MKTVSILALAAIAGLSTPAMAQNEGEGQRAAQPQAEEQAADEDEEYLNETVCRTERVTGSLTRVNRVCMTRREWNAASERTQRQVREWDNNANKASAQTGPVGGLGGGGGF